MNGGFKDLPIEVFESKFPVMLRNYGIRADTGGAGEWRGGCGVYREYTVEVPTYLSLWFDRSVTPAWGLLGGASGGGPDVELTFPDGRQQHLLKANAMQIPAGTIVRTMTGGGGGFGAAIERPVELVVNDVRDGYVSREAAADQFGVVLGDGGDVDLEATAKARAAGPGR